MPKIPKQRRLEDVLEPGFAHGYERFHELVTKTVADSELSQQDKVFLTAYERSSVAFIETLNRVEERFGVPPVEAMVLLWTAVGAALSTVTAQAITDEGASTARRLMRKQLMDGYDHGLNAFTTRGGQSRG